MTKKKKLKIAEEDLKIIYGDDYDFFQAKILNNCFCLVCAAKGRHSTIINYEIFINDLNDIVLQGFCAECGGKIGRYLETGEVEEYLPRIGKIRKKYILNMVNKENNFAYIDGANLRKGIRELGWNLDYMRFRVWLKDKYSVERAYIFIGLVSKNKDLYTFLQEAGFTLVFKETTCDGEGKIKGNCDADLVLKAVIDYYEKQFNNVVIVASDGDYAGLVNFFKEKGVFRSLISPNNKCSFLLRKLNVPLVYLDTKRNTLNYIKKEKAPGRDEPYKGLFHSD